MVKIHFGTDGIRGKANENLTIDMAYRIGRYLGKQYPQGKILIGRDTRLSGGMFQTALAAGLTASGCNAYLLPFCSTPCLIYLVIADKFDSGIMITASHNPFTDNGIKIISAQGTKIDAQLEADIEEYMYGEGELEYAIKDQIGETYLYEDGVTNYLNHLRELFPLDLKNYKIALDCANGSNSFIAPNAFRTLGCNVDVINYQPNGVNINRDCGSTHIDALVKFVKEGNYDCGFAFDGDADRVIAVAKDGQVVDGDKILYSYGKYLLKHGKLNGGKIVTTVMANLGLFKKLDEQNIGYEMTAVGDKYVHQCMDENGYVLGGEQSGHIIISQYATTGDGLLTALALMQMQIDEKADLNALTDDLFIYPQLLVNIEVKDKEAAMKDEDVLAECKKVEEALNGQGRVLVRCSGTEPLVRVMVEAKTDELCAKYCYQVIDVIKQKGL